MGDFMEKLRKNESISAKALEFLILTAVRSGSVRMAEWSELDLEKRMWVIPAGHTKARQEHRVPLQPQAIELLQSLPRMAETQIVFASPTGKALSDMALSQIMRGMRERCELTVKAVPHGFRSTFRIWAAEQTDFPDDMRKIASCHTVSDAVKKAYERTDLLEKRRQLMNEWATFIDKPSFIKAGTVTNLKRKVS
jgi:integrase